MTPIVFYVSLKNKQHPHHPVLGKAQFQMHIDIDGGSAIMILIVLAIFFYEWFRRFIALMLLSDDCFPGRYDKLIWGLAFVFLFFVAPITFYYWQRTYLELRKEESGNKTPSVS